MAAAHESDSRWTGPGLSAVAVAGCLSGVSPLQRIGLKLEHWKLVRQRTVRVPTWQGALLLLLLAAVAATGMIRGIYPFLAVTDRLAADVLVIEGWAPEFALQAGVEEFRRGGYRQFYATGGPLEKGDPNYELGSFAELGRGILVRLGAPADRLRAVPAPKIRRERTFASAVALRETLRRQGPLPGAINVMTIDTHARRTRLAYENAFGGSTKIGIIAITDERFEVARWWRSSAGFRKVVEESVGYLYARFFSRYADDMVDFRT